HNHATQHLPVHADQSLLPLRALPRSRPQHQPATRNATRRERGRRGLLTPVNGGARQDASTAPPASVATEPTLQSASPESRLNDQPPAPAHRARSAITRLGDC